MHTMILRLLIILTGLSFSSIYGAIHGKIDLGPTLVSIDILESGKTTKTLNMKGLKGDMTLILYEGLYIKPSFIWGKGDGQFSSGTIAVGYYLPITKDLRILPSVGMTWSYLHTHVDFDQFNLFDLKERFHSNSSFIGQRFVTHLQIN